MEEENMEKKNTVLLTVIAVATLLVAVVGATFAYFTATATTEGNAAGNTDVKAAKLANVKLNVATIAGSNNVVYPGTKNYVGASAKAAVDTVEGAEAGEYNVTYTVTGKVTLGEAFAFPVNYSLYKVSAAAAVSDPVTCENVATTTNGTAVQYTQNCTVAAGLGTAVQTGSLAAGETEKTITLADQVIATDATTTDYYYLVVEYPNDTTQAQDADQGKSVKAEIVSVTATASAAK